MLSFDTWVVSVTGQVMGLAVVDGYGGGGWSIMEIC